MTAREFANYKNIFLLSERGYTKLVAMMANDNEKKWGSTSCWGDSKKLKKFKKSVDTLKQRVYN